MQKRKQRRQAPTVGLGSVFIISTIDAKESRKMVTIDFLHAENEAYIIMKMVGTLDELIIKTNPKIQQQYMICATKMSFQRAPRELPKLPETKNHQSPTKDATSFVYTAPVVATT